MAYVNVAEWKTEQVCEWLKGLENSVLPYVHSFMNHGVNGQQLLSLRPEDLEHFGVVKLGHQEIILQAVEYLRNFHYELDRENLQLLALRLSCQAHSLHNELSRQTDSKPVTTQTLSDVASVMTAVKPLVRWLDCSPFSGQLEYNDKKNELMKLALEMATCAQRDRFAEKPIEEIRTICCQLAKLADYIIQDIPDPMILQPASLDLATLKKKPGDDLGFHILPSFHGAHQIAEIKFGSAAHQCGKMEEGDEIVQVNYQTVVGWERKNLLELFRESPAEVLLTLKRRPRHTKVYGQIYIKPYRLPSNKKISYTTRWQHNLPSPRPELLTIPDFTMPLPRHMPKNPSPEPASILDTVNILDTMIIDSSDSDSEAEPPLPTRLYSAKPRNLVQRRATITGASPTTKHGIDIEQFWKELKQEHSTTFQLRDKAASCAHGLDNVPSNLRPQTCLGIEQNKRRKRIDAQIDEKKVHFQEKAGECNNAQTSDVANILECENESNFKNPNSGTTNVKSTSLTGQAFQSVSTVTESYKGSDVSVPLDECNNLISNRSNCNKKAGSGKESNIRNIKDRGKLDKSHSTPAYDFADTDDIEDRKQKLLEQSTSAAAGTLAHHSNKTPKPSTKTEIRVTVDDYDEQQQILNNAEPNHKTNHLSDNVTLNANSLDSCVSQDHSVQQSVSGLAEESKLFGSITNVQTAELISEDPLKNNQSNNISTDLIVNTEIDSSTGRGLNTLIENMPCNAEQDKNKETVNSKHEQAESRLESVVGNNSTLDVREKLSEDTAIIEDAKINNTESSSVILNCKDQRKEERNLKGSKHSDEDNLQNACTKTSQVSPDFKLQNDNASVVDSPDEGSPTQPCKYVELVNIESGKKLEGRSLIPPDPPPRKYHTKSPATQIMNTSMDSNSRNSEDRDNVYVPERPIVRRDLKKPELYTESYGRSTDRQERRNSYDIYSNFVDKSVEFTDASGSALNNSRLSFDLDNCPYIDASNKHVKEERIICDKYDHFTETAASSNQIPWEYSRTEHFRNIDSPDGSPYSKQHVDFKFKTLEKDKNVEKGVVNKAMMVARSIGLHGSLSKTTNSSPRSSRKQSILFARKRNVSVKDLGAGDLEGWLTYRSRGAGGAWAKAWFVLKCPSLYRFKMLESIKADCLIALTGFTVSQAAEVKSRKYAFKVYHTGTVFYFAADTEDSLAMWLDAINKATLGADGHTRSSTLFSETDESDSENKYKGKTSPALENKPNSEKSFGSLKKVTRKDSGCKDSDIGGASLDRKYLKFLGARSQNVPVPTAQFRSYRRVLPNSTPNKKQNPTPSSPDLQMTIAGSTFYGLCTSQSASDMATNTQDMGDYRRTTDRCFNNRNRRVDDLQGFITLEEFMLSQQSEERRQTAGNRSVSPRATPLTSDHVHVQYTNLHDNGASGEQSRHVSEASFSNDVIEFGSRGHDEASCNSIPYGYSRNTDNTHTARQYNGNHSLEQIETRSEYSKAPIHKKFRDSYTSKRTLQDSSSTSEAKSYDVVYLKSNTASRKPSASLYCNKSDPVHAAARQMEPEYDQQSRACNHPMEPWNNCEISKSRDYFSSRNFANLIEDIKSVPKKLVRNDGHSGSSSDLTSHASYESFQRVKKEATVSRKGSFNLSKHRENTSTDRHWLESLKRTDKKNNSDKSRLKNVAQYQPPPIASSPFEQDGMRAAFEMHLDKAEQVQKPNRLKSLFGSKTHQKPCTLELPKDSPKTLLGSPRLHRAVFRDKSSSNQLQHRLCSDTCYHSPSDSGVSQGVSSFSGTSSSHTLSQSFSSASSISDWSPETPSSCTPNTSRCPAGHLSCHKGFANHGRHSATPPTLPYIPPPTSPPPDYPGLEYPPVFEPGTYSLSDASVLRNRNKDVRNSS